MKPARALALSVLLLALVGVLLPAHAAEPVVGDTTDVIVRLHDGASPGDLAVDVRAWGGDVHATYRHAVPGLAAAVPEAAVAALRADPRVAAVEPDVTVRAFQTPTGVRRVGADAFPPADIDGDGSAVDVDVAIVDTGVDGTHADLRVVGGVDCRTGTCTATATPTDPNGHGTHVAGTVAARDDGTGVVGVAPGARLYAVRVLEADGSGSLSALLAGLDWVQANAAEIEVANLSLGCECRSTTLDDAVSRVTASGTTLVVAAGNAGSDAGGFSPANHPDVIAVAAMSDYDGQPGRRSLLGGCIPDADDVFASYSNYGAVVDLVAPGSCIRSTVPGGGYGRSTGTSMAAPHVAGAAALHISSQSLPRTSTRAAEVRQALLDRYSVPFSDGCGYTDSVSVARMLHLTCAAAVAEEAPNQVPELEVSSPQDGLTIVSGETVALRARATDPEDGTLDAEIVWTSSQAGRLGVGASLDVTLTQVGDHTITASVTDSGGANTRTSRLVRVTTADGSTGGSTGEQPSVPQEPEPEASPDTNREPQVRLVAPVPDSQLLKARNVQLVAQAVDAEDGDIRAWVQWRSDLDGDLGTGGTVKVLLSAGSHRITATVTDSAGVRVERSTTVSVGAAEDLRSRSISGACPPERTDDGGFDDVPEDNPHAAAIDCVAWWGIARGTGSGYAPGRDVSRGQMATFLAELVRRSGGSLPAPSRDHFDDDDDTPHEDNINRLAEVGVVAGTGAASYAPGRSVTREQMATFLRRVYEYRSMLPLPGIQERFDDVGTTHATGVDAVAAAGIAAGTAPDRYDPSVPVRRDQMASFLARTLDVLVAMNVTAPPS